MERAPLESLQPLPLPLLLQLLHPAPPSAYERH